MLDLLEIFLKYTHTRTHAHIRTHARMCAHTHKHRKDFFYIYKNITVPFSYFYCYFFKKFWKSVHLWFSNKQYVLTFISSIAWQFIPNIWNDIPTFKKIRPVLSFSYSTIWFIFKYTHKLSSHIYIK